MAFCSNNCIECAYLYEQNNFFMKDILLAMFGKVEKELIETIKNNCPRNDIENIRKNIKEWLENLKLRQPERNIEISYIYYLLNKTE